MEAAVYRDLALRRTEEERPILLDLTTAQARSSHETDTRATATMADDEQIHEEVVRARGMGMEEAQAKASRVLAGPTAPETGLTPLIGTD